MPNIPATPTHSRAEKSEIISSTEYRARLVDKQRSTKRKCEPKLKNPKRKSKAPNKKLGESSKTTFKDLVREEWFCPICEGPNNRQDDDEQWVECRLCTVYIHIVFSNKRVCFICKEQ